MSVLSLKAMSVGGTTKNISVNFRANFIFVDFSKPFDGSYQFQCTKKLLFRYFLRRGIDFTAAVMTAVMTAAPQMKCCIKKADEFFG
jgi:hypothetical protein